jgi:serine/threonine protein kinase
MAAVPEKSLERYELLERIAVGGMAEVFRAKAFGAHGFEKTLAIKRILPELAADREFEQRFISEAKLAVQLSHGNIVQVFDFGKFDDSLFIAMEFVQGLDLAAMLKRYRERDERVPLQAAFHIAVELARGLDFAHEYGVVHRDVSPSNILLSKAGEVKIADFGIAEAAAKQVTRHTGRRRIMGKWRYMSPEQTRGEDLSTQSDLFSLASVLFEMFTGRKLFPGDEAEDIIKSIHEMEIPPASGLRAGLPTRLDEVLAKALARDPERRPVRASEMQRALTEISYDSSIVATPLDVSDAVVSVLSEVEMASLSNPAIQLPGLGIDDHIRKQLGGKEPAKPPATNRRTAVDSDDLMTADMESAQAEAARRARKKRETEPQTRPATIVRTGVDAEGVTMWELGSEDTIAAVPSAIKYGKHTGSVSAIKDGESSADEAAPPPQRRSALFWIAALGVIGALAGGAWLATRGGDKEQTAQLEPGAGAAISDDRFDAGALPTEDPRPVTAMLSVQSIPPGGTVFVDGEPIEGVTPLEIAVEPDVEHDVRVEMAGFAPYPDDDIVVPAGATVIVRAKMTKNRASLKVTSTPSGATVTMGGKVLGKTPLELDGLAPAKRQRLSIALDGYDIVYATVDLVPTEPAKVDKRLTEEKEASGKIHIYMDEGWADIYLGRKKIGRATTRKPLTLPIGTHKLRLHNPVSKKEKILTVKVTEGQTKPYRTKLD